MQTKVYLSAYDFTVCLLAALSRQGQRSLVSPWSDTQHVTSRCAAKVFDWLEETQEGIFDFRFHLSAHKYAAEGWVVALRQCENFKHLTRRVNSNYVYYELNDANLQRSAMRISSFEQIWDAAASIYLQAHTVLIASL